MRPIVAFAVATLLLAACSRGHATSAVTTTTSRVTAPSANQGDPAQTTINPTVTVTPNKELREGQRVKVQVTGFGVDGKVWLSECGAISNLSDVGCGPRLALQPSLTTDKHRAGSATFVVHDRAPVTANNSTDVKACVSKCVVMAVGGGGFAYTPISFHS
jgi:hypothetical protein